jgi:hypothetical protein
MSLSLLIRASFSGDEDEAICRMVPSPLGSADKRIWIDSSTGVYIVRSAYYSEMFRRAQAKGESSGVKEENEIWQAIWNLKAPAAVQNFVRKMCFNILPTKVQLNRRHMALDPALFVNCTLKIFGMLCGLARLL